MRLSTSSLLLFAMLFFLSTAARADEAPRWHIDPPHSAVTFSIKHILAQVPGQFLDFSAEVAFAPQHPEASSLSFSIETASVNTHVTKRDEHLRTADFFAAKQFPHITFAGSSIEKTGQDQYAVHGVLTIKGVSREVRLPLQYLGTKENPMHEGIRVLGLHSAFTLDRLEYGVGSGKFYEMGVVGKNVDLEVHLELLDSPPEE